MIDDKAATAVGEENELVTHSTVRSRQTLLVDEPSQPSRSLNWYIWMGVAILTVLLSASFMLDIPRMLGFVMSEGWVVLVMSIIALAAAFMLLLMLAGVGFFIMAVLSFIWVLLAIVSFPILSPLLLPLVIILWFAVSIRRRQRVA